MVYYRENDDFWKERAAGKDKQRAKLETLERVAESFFDAFWDTYKLIMATDMEEAEAFLAACYESREAMKEIKAPPSKRARNVERTKEGINRNAKQERDRELSPEGRAIFDALEAAAAELLKDRAFNSVDEEIEWADRFYEEAEAPLNALALKNPEEATRIFARSNFFDEYISPHAVYLGQGVIVDRSELRELDTPEKRAAYVNSVNDPFGDEDGADDLPGEDETSAGDLPLTISGGAAVKLDGREPVTLAGITDPVKIG